MHLDYLIDCFLNNFRSGFSYLICSEDFNIYFSFINKIVILDIFSLRFVLNNLKWLLIATNKSGNKKKKQNYHKNTEDSFK